MSEQDEKKPPIGGLVEVDAWRMRLMSNNTVELQRLGTAGKVIEVYAPMFPGRAAVALMAILQGCEPPRTLRLLEPVGPEGY